MPRANVNDRRSLEEIYGRTEFEQDAARNAMADVAGARAGKVARLPPEHESIERRERPARETGPQTWKRPADPAGRSGRALDQACQNGFAASASTSAWVRAMSRIT